MKQKEIIKNLEKRIIENHNKAEEARERFRKDKWYGETDSIKYSCIVCELIEILVDIKGTSIDYEFERLLGE